MHGIEVFSISMHISAAEWVVNPRERKIDRPHTHTRRERTL